MSSSHERLVKALEALRNVSSPESLPAVSAEISAAAEDLGDEVGQVAGQELEHGRWDSSPLAIHFLLTILADNPCVDISDMLCSWLLAPASSRPNVDKGDLVDAMSSIHSSAVESAFIQALTASPDVIPDEYGGIRATIIETLVSRNCQDALDSIRSLVDSDVGKVSDAAVEALDAMAQT
jgi:hypothetical protein